jgi:peptidylglycine monooxygenase
MTAHHMLIYGCEKPGTDDLVWNCGEMLRTATQPGMKTAAPCSRGARVIYAWAMDAPALILPKQVGFKVGANSDINYLVLQVHYASVDHFKS